MVEELRIEALRLLVHVEICKLRGMEQLRRPEHLQGRLGTVTVPEIGTARIHENLAFSDRFDLPPARIVENGLPVLLVARGPHDGPLGVPGGTLPQGPGPPKPPPAGGLPPPPEFNPVTMARPRASTTR